MTASGVKTARPYLLLYWSKFFVSKTIVIYVKICFVGFPRLRRPQYHINKHRSDCDQFHLRHRVHQTQNQRLQGPKGEIDPPDRPLSPVLFQNLRHNTYSTTYAMPATYYTEQRGWGRDLNDYPAQMLEEWEMQQIPLNRCGSLKNDTNSSPTLPKLCPAFLNDHIFNQSCLILVKKAVPNNHSDLGVVAMKCPLVPSSNTPNRWATLTTATKRVTCNLHKNVFNSPLSKM